MHIWSCALTTVKTHPEFPFVKIGQVRELSPDDGPDPIFSPDDWLIQVTDVEDGGDPVESGVYRSAESATAAVEAWLFAPNRGWLVARHIERAWKEGKLDLVVKLAECRGRAEAYSKAQGELAAVNARILAALG